MEKEKCYFEMSSGRYKKCAALTKHNCDGCKFYKTPFQAMEDQRRAALKLKERGLMPYQKGDIMTVKPIKQKLAEYNHIHDYTKPGKEDTDE